MVGICGCRESKPAPAGAAGQTVDGGVPATVDAATTAATTAAWATWPMPNSTPGLPNPQSFDTQSAGVVIDRVTGLMWQRNLDDKFVTFASAIEQCHRLTLAGYDDWRLPSRIELVSIVDVTRTQPSINVTAFPQTPNDWFWTSSVAAADPQAAWYVYFYFGYPKTDGMTNQFSVRCVRTTAPRPASATRYDIQTDTVRDAGTGLTWERAVPAQTFVFDAARAYCSQLTLGGRTGWRAPSLVELLTLIDERAAVGPMIDITAFPNTPNEAFWSSSYFGGSAGMAWQVYFDHGNGLYGLPSATFRVRCVS